ARRIGVLKRDRARRGSLPLRGNGGGAEGVGNNPIGRDGAADLISVGIRQRGGVSSPVQRRAEGVAGGIVNRGRGLSRGADRDARAVSSCGRGRIGRRAGTGGSHGSVRESKRKGSDVARTRRLCEVPVGINVVVHDYRLIFRAVAIS